MEKARRRVGELPTATEVAWADEKMEMAMEQLKDGQLMVKKAMERKNEVMVADVEQGEVSQAQNTAVCSLELRQQRPSQQRSRQD